MHAHNLGTSGDITPLFDVYHVEKKKKKKTIINFVDFLIFLKPQLRNCKEKSKNCFVFFVVKNNSGKPIVYRKLSLCLRDIIFFFFFLFLFFSFVEEVFEIFFWENMDIDVKIINNRNTEVSVSNRHLKVKSVGAGEEVEFRTFISEKIMVDGKVFHPVEKGIITSICFCFLKQKNFFCHCF